MTSLICVSTFLSVTWTLLLLVLLPGTSLTSEADQVTFNFTDASDLGSCLELESGEWRHLVGRIVNTDVATFEACTEYCRNVASTYDVIAATFVEHSTACVCSAFSDDDCSDCDAMSCDVTAQASSEEVTCQTPQDGDNVCNTEFISGATLLTIPHVISVTNVTVSPSSNVTSFQVLSNRNSSLIIDFGDGSDGTYNSSVFVEHTYLVPAVYNISISALDGTTSYFEANIQDLPVINSVRIRIYIVSGSLV